MNDDLIERLRDRAATHRARLGTNGSTLWDEAADQIYSLQCSLASSDSYIKDLETEVQYLRNCISQFERDKYV